MSPFGAVNFHGTGAEKSRLRSCPHLGWQQERGCANRVAFAVEDALQLADSWTFLSEIVQCPRLGWVKLSR
ncbi:hypothetical protein BN2476_110298 [Paraburkholderia piptadeniae]|uniref:Uncharacterized protein n=1 Tax=Paraburkholderia piptadeniae TaxID=1701573 RepID=A0A1N7RQV9_9BURK|nr:hypothetical protein BN2476_110298 [Paraburkholderia piptadeniae]